MAITAIALNEGVSIMEDAGLKAKDGATAFSERQAGTWLSLFSDWSDERFLSACIQAARTLTFFPAVGELRACGGESAQALETKAVEAWEMVRAAVRRHGSCASFTASDVGNDPVALWCMERIGVQEIGDMTSENRAIKAAEFRRLYAAAVENGHKLDYLVGAFEAQNAFNGHAQTPSALGRPDWPSLEIVKGLRELPTEEAPQLPAKVKRIPK